MNEQTYRLLFKGETIPGIEINTVKQNVAQLYKVELAKAEKLFTGKIFVLKNGINLAAAQKFMFDFENAGAICEIEKIPMEPPKPEPVIESMSAKPAGAEPPTPTVKIQDMDNQGINNYTGEAIDKPASHEYIAQPSYTPETPQIIDDAIEPEKDEPLLLSLDIQIPSPDAFEPEIPEPSLPIDTYSSSETANIPGAVDIPEPPVQIMLDIPEDISIPESNDDPQRIEEPNLQPEHVNKPRPSTSSFKFSKPKKKENQEKPVKTQVTVTDEMKSNGQFGFRKTKSKSSSFNPLFIAIPLGVLAIAAAAYFLISFLGNRGSNSDGSNTTVQAPISAQPAAERKPPVESPDLSEETTETFTDQQNLFSVVLPSGFSEDHNNSIQPDFLSQYRFRYMKKTGNSEKASVIIRISKGPQEFTIITAQNNKEKEIAANQDIYLSGCQTVKSESNPISGSMGYRIFLESNDNSGRIARFYEFASNRNTVFSIWIISYTAKNVDMLSRYVEESLMVN